MRSLLIWAWLLLLAGCGSAGDPRSVNPQDGGSGTFLFASNADASTISAFRVDATTGALTAVSGSPFGGVDAPAGLAVHPNNALLAVANQSGNAVSMLRIGTGGALTPVTGSPFAGGALAGPVEFSAAGDFLFVGNLNFDNSISVYSVNDASGTLLELNLSPFNVSTQINWMARHPSGNFLYTVGGGISAFAVNSNGTLTELTGSPFHTGISMANAHVAMHPGGNFLAVADRDARLGAGGVRVFVLNFNGTVGAEVAGSPFATGTEPVHVAFNATGTLAFVANRLTSNVSVYAVNPATGALIPVSGSPFSAGSGPFSLLVHPSGDFLYVANQFSDNISAFQINATTGALTPIAGSPFASGDGTAFLAMTTAP